MLQSAPGGVVRWEGGVSSIGQRCGFCSADGVSEGCDRLKEEHGAPIHVLVVMCSQMRFEFDLPSCQVTAGARYELRFTIDLTRPPLKQHTIDTQGCTICALAVSLMLVLIAQRKGSNLRIRYRLSDQTIYDHISYQITLLS